MITGIKKKINVLELRAVGMYIPNHSERAKKTIPQLGKMERTYFFDHKETILTNYKIQGAVKRDFSFTLERKDKKDFPETYYGSGYATKYVIYANITVDDSHEGQAKIEYQIRNYVMLIILKCIG